LDTLRQMLVFSVGEHQYAMDILNLREVGRMPQLEAEPGAPGDVLGIARLHGEPVRVRELATRLGEAARHVGAEAHGLHRPWLIVSRGRQGDDHWLVDAVQDIVEYDPTQVRPTDEADPARRIAGLIEIGGRLTYLLTPELLIEGAAP
jgi:chemotaxis signal transduction protein